MDKLLAAKNAQMYEMAKNSTNCVREKYENRCEPRCRRGGAPPHECGAKDTISTLFQRRDKDGGRSAARAHTS